MYVFVYIYMYIYTHIIIEKLEHLSHIFLMVIGTQEGSTANSR